MSATEQLLIQGPVGNIDTILESPKELRGIAIICHPHPLFGGANTNKVAHTLARSLRELGYAALRPNFRGVGKSAGSHDQGKGEAEDILAVIDWAQARFGAELPLVLAGFSFGAYVQTRVATQLGESGRAVQQLVLVGTAAGHVEGARHYETQAVDGHALVIHGSADETVPLPNVMAWAEPLEVPVIVVPGADHFFHGRLHIIRDIIKRHFCQYQ